MHTKDTSLERHRELSKRLQASVALAASALDSMDDTQGSLDTDRIYLSQDEGNQQSAWQFLWGGAFLSLPAGPSRSPRVLRLCWRGLFSLPVTPNGMLSADHWRPMLRRALQDSPGGNIRQLVQSFSEPAHCPEFYCKHPAAAQLQQTGLLSFLSAHN